MTHTLLSHKLTSKSFPDELHYPGDYYLVNSLGSTDKLINAHPAIVLKCPYCRGDMASVPRHKITISHSWWRRLWGYPKQITVDPMLQCPYNPSHKFLIYKDKIIAV